MRVVFCGGGTGGHVYPALTVAAALRRATEGKQPLDILYIGVKGKMDRELVVREGIAFRAVTAGPLRVCSALGTAQGLWRLLIGTAEAYMLLGRFRPDAVFATGGYGSVGVGLAAKLRGRPLLLFLPDVEAGLAVRVLAKVAARIAVTVDAALKGMPKGKTIVTGYPVRPSFFGVDREQARRCLGLHPSLPTLFVSGASLGANRINKAVVNWAADFLRVGQIIHLCGGTDEAWLKRERQKLPLELQERYRVYSYLHENISMALASADVAVMRSGGSALGELPAVGLPAILVPGEYEGWDQSPNARYLEQAGAAIMLPQSRLGELQKNVMSLLADGEKRERMRQALARLSCPQAADRLAQILLDIGGKARAGA